MDLYVAIPGKGNCSVEGRELYLRFGIFLRVAGQTTLFIGLDGGFECTSGLELAKSISRSRCSRLWASSFPVSFRPIMSRSNFRAYRRISAILPRGLLRPG